MPSTWVSPQLYEILTHGVNQDLSFYEQESLDHFGPILDIGAGLGRISTPLLKYKQPVVLLEHNPHMCAELCRRLSELSEDTQQNVWVLEQDATTIDHLDVHALQFGDPNSLPEQFSLIVLGLRTIHLFDQNQRHHILSLAKQLLTPNGALVLHYSDLAKAPPQPEWRLVAEHLLEGGTIEVEECFFHHTPTQMYHLRHRIWQSNDLGQHVGSWRVAHNLYAVDLQALINQLSDMGFQTIQNPSLHGTESFIVAEV